MKALIWKEFRENIHWALLLALLIGSAMVFALFDIPDSNYGRWESIVSQTFLTVTSFGFPLAALALAFLQITPELRKDRWAFWIHRPISRNHLFFSKVGSGMILYFCATLLPMVIAILWVTIPLGPELPFTPAMVLPATINLLIGLVLYFGAVCAGLTQGKWYGRRAIALLSALGVTFVLNLMSEQNFTGLLPWIFCSLGAFLFTAWALITNDPNTRFLPAWGKIPAAFVFGFFWMLLITASTAILYSILGSNFAYENTSYEVTAGGQPVRVVRDRYGSAKYFDLNGKALEKESDVSPEKFLAQTALALTKPEELLLSSKSGSQYFISLSQRNRGHIAWFFDRQHLVFVGYDKEFKRRSGYFGTKGASLSISDAGPFPGKFIPDSYSLNGPAIWRFSNEAWFADPTQNIARLLLATGPDDPIRAAQEIQRQAGDDRSNFAAVVTEKKIVVFDSDNKEKTSFLHPFSLDGMGSVTLVPNSKEDRYFLFYYPKYKSGKLPQFAEIDTTGKILSQKQLPSNFFNYEAMKAGTKKCNIVLSMVIPPSLYLAIRNGDPDGASENYMLWSCFGMALFSATLIWTLRRRLDLSKNCAIAWSVFALIAGIHGLLAMLFIEGFPRRSACPTCSKKRFLHRNTCEHCDAIWPKRKPDGTEVMEPALAEI